MMNQQYVFHTKVHRDWVDHNGHLNDAMYNRIFSDTTDDWLGHLGLTINAIQSYQYTVFTLENHVMFLNEMKENEDVIVKVHLHNYDSKRLDDISIYRSSYRHQEKAKKERVIQLRI